MSYCRMNGITSDVYVVRSHVLICYHTDGNSFHAVAEQRMIDHLTEHRERGEKVPQRALDRLEAERDGREYKTDVQLELEAIGIETRTDLIISPVTGERVRVDTEGESH